MFVKTYRNFLCEEECAFLNKVALSNIGKWFDDGWDTGGTRTKLRLTTRMYMGEKKYPSKILDISKRVRQQAGINTYPLIANHGSDGIVCSIIYQGGDIYEHKDPKSVDGLPTYRCNILTQANENGANLYVDGKKINIEVGDLHCYMVSELPHYVTEAKGVTPRIMWLFGAHIPKENWVDYDLS